MISTGAQQTLTGINGINQRIYGLAQQQGWTWYPNPDVQRQAAADKMQEAADAQNAVLTVIQEDLQWMTGFVTGLFGYDWTCSQDEAVINETFLIRQQTYQALQDMLNTPKPAGQDPSTDHWNSYIRRVRLAIWKAYERMGNQYDQWILEKEYQRLADLGDTEGRKFIGSMIELVRRSQYVGNAAPTPRFEEYYPDEIGGGLSGLGSPVVAIGAAVSLVIIAVGLVAWLLSDKVTAALIDIQNNSARNRAWNVGVADALAAQKSGQPPTPTQQAILDELPGLTPTKPKSPMSATTVVLLLGGLAVAGYMLPNIIRAKKQA